MPLSIAIQHHPKRPELLGPLMAAMTPGPPPNIVFDPDPNNPHPSPWRTYRRALEETPAWASHRLIVQDDALVCRSFPLAAQRAVAARPEAVVVFCVLGAPKSWAMRVITAANSDSPWAELHFGAVRTWLPVVATSWPANVIRPALDYVDSRSWPNPFRADDEIAGRIVTDLKLKVLATAPSLVDHPDVVPSSMGRRTAQGGLNPNRVAACFIDDSCCDPLSIDWR